MRYSRANLNYNYEKPNEKGNLSQIVFSNPEANVLSHLNDHYSNPE
jgi:hypothetical protein